MLYDNHVNQVYRYAISRVLDEDIATDLTEKVFLTMLDKLPQINRRELPFQQPIPFEAFLMRIAKTENDNYVKEHKSEINTLRQKYGPVLQEINKLPDMQRDVLVLQHASGLSAKLISKTLRISERRVNVLYMEALRTLGNSELGQSLKQNDKLTT